MCKIQSIKYRPDIDGLRAIAVLAVIFYHTKIIFHNHELFKGGFVGVDIFFVISGYLISSIIIFADYNYYFGKRIKNIKNNKIELNDFDFIFTKRNEIQLDENLRYINLEKHIYETLNNLANDNVILLVYPTPQPQTDISNHILNNYRDGVYENNDYFLVDEINYNGNIYDEFNNEIISFFQTIKNKNIYHLHMKDLFCDTKCVFYDESYTYFFDRIHPSKKGSEIINNFILKQIVEIQNEK